MHRAVFYEFPEADPNTDRFTYKTTSHSVTIVLVGDLSMVPVAAKEMADAGIELIELCGGMPLAVRVQG